MYGNGSDSRLHCGWVAGGSGHIQSYICLLATSACPHPPEGGSSISPKRVDALALGYVGNIVHHYLKRKPDDEWGYDVEYTTKMLSRSKQEPRKPQTRPLGRKLRSTMRFDCGDAETRLGCHLRGGISSGREDE